MYAQDQQLDAAKAKIDAKDFEGAKADLKKVIDAAPKNKQAFNLRGLARTGLNDFYGNITEKCSGDNKASAESIYSSTCLDSGVTISMST